MLKEKVTAEERMEAAKVCAEGRMTQAEAARRLGVGRTRIREWVDQYKASGVLAFRKQKYNAIYSEELKTAVVKDYLSGADSQTVIAAKYGLRSTRQLRNWIKVYKVCEPRMHKKLSQSAVHCGKHSEPRVPRRQAERKVVD